MRVFAFSARSSCYQMLPDCPKAPCRRHASVYSAMPPQSNVPWLLRFDTCHLAKSGDYSRATAQHPGRHCTSYAGSIFVLNPRLSSSRWRSGASLSGNSPACTLGTTRRSPLRLKAAYFPGCEVILMSTNEIGACGGAFDFLPHRGMAMDSTSPYSSLKLVPSSKNIRA
jgi:hypothetical protein